MLTFLDKVNSLRIKNGEKNEGKTRINHFFLSVSYYTLPLQVSSMETNSDLKNKSGRGVIYLGHIPHGFYEEEIRNYFKQFGKVTNLRVCRSRKSGRSKGFGFVEFANNEVAKIAAETMNNYLMFKKRMIAQYVPPEKRHPRLFANKVQWSTRNYPLKGQHRSVVTRHNTDLDDKGHLKQTGRLMKTVRRTLKKLADMGIAYDFQPVDKPDIVRKSLDLKDNRANELINKVRKHLGKTGCINDNIITRSKSKVGK